MKSLVDWFEGVNKAASPPVHSRMNATDRVIVVVFEGRQVHFEFDPSSTPKVWEVSVDGGNVGSARLCRGRPDAGRDLVQPGVVFRSRHILPYAAASSEDLEYYKEHAEMIRVAYRLMKTAWPKENLSPPRP